MAGPEVPAAIAQCHQAGIQVTMVTGDYGLTAAAIAHRIGLVDDKAKVVTGEQLGPFRCSIAPDFASLAVWIGVRRMLPEKLGWCRPIKTWDMSLRLQAMV